MPFETASWGENVKQLSKQKVAQSVTNSPIWSPCLRYSPQALDMTVMAHRVQTVTYLPGTTVAKENVEFF